MTKDDKTAASQPLDLTPESRNPDDGEPAKMHTSNRSTPDVYHVHAADDQTITPQTPNEVGNANGSSDKDTVSTTAIDHWDATLDTLPTDSPQDGRVESFLQKDGPKDPISSPGSKSKRSSKESTPAKVKAPVHQLRHRIRNTAKFPHGGIEVPRAASQPAPSFSPATLTIDRPKSSRTAMSTPTFSLCSPRFSQLSKNDHEIDGNTQESRTDMLDDGSSFDLDGDTTKNGLGLDGQMDLVYPSAASSIFLAGIRTSGRTRKPTIRAIESLDSQQSLRKANQNARMESSTGEASKGRTSVPQDENISVSGTGFEKKSDLQRVSERLFEAAMAALLPEFEKSVNGDNVIEEIHREFEDGKKASLDADSTGRDSDKTVSKDTPKSLEGNDSNKPEESRPSPCKEPFHLQSHPQQTEKPWTDEDGWTHTGHTNIYGEEMAVVPESFEWYRPSDSYGADKLPVPPIRFKSRDQVQKDGIFGFPPPAGQRNVPRDVRVPFVTEDVEVEKAKVRAREEARKRDISLRPLMSLEEIRDIVQDYDRRAAVDPALKKFEPISPVRSERGVAERSRRRRRENRSSYPTTGRGDNADSRLRRRRETHNVGLPSPQKAENNQPRTRRRRQKAHSLDAPVSESRAGTPTAPAKTNTKTGASSPAKSRRRGFAHVGKKDTEKERREEIRKSEEQPRKRLKLIITRPEMERELASNTTTTTATTKKDTNAEQQEESTATATTTHEAAPITLPTADAETVTTPQSTAHNIDNNDEQDTGETAGGRPKRRAAAAASATNSQIGTKSRKSNPHKRKVSGDSSGSG